MEDIVNEEDKGNLISFIKTTKRYTQFTKVRDFENIYSEWQGCKYSIFVNSGSSANLLLIDTLKEKYGWNDGDEIIVPAITWITNISPIFQCGLKPVFVDINLSDFSFDYKQIENQITKKTKAIFITHLIGFPSNVNKIKEIIKDKDIKIIEDCCESHGATIDNIKVGNHGLASTFSFYWGHHITTIEGGMVCTNNEDLYQRLLLKRAHGLARELPKELHEAYKKKYPDIDFEFLFLTNGFNFRNTEFNAVLGLSQIKKLDKFIEIRNKNYDRFYEICKKYHSHLITLHNPGISSFTLPFIFKDMNKKQQFQKRLNQEGIQTRPMIGGNLLKQPFLSDYKNDRFTNADFIHHNAFYIGNNQFVGEERLTRLQNIMEDFFNTKMNKESRIYISGHTGLVGSALVKLLRAQGYLNLILKTHEELDLRNQIDVEEFFQAERPEFVFMFAAKVGGIKAHLNTPAEFIYDNIQIQNNLIHLSWKYNIKKLLFLGSACIYPTNSPQPIKEQYLMDGKPESSYESFAIAKISGISMCQAYNKQHETNFITVIPSNIYGPGDHFDLENSHLLSALINRFHNAKTNQIQEVTLWGTGTPRRDLLYVDDAAKACLFLMQNYNSSEVINVGTGSDMTVREIGENVKQTIGYNGEIFFDTTKPDGTMKRQVDTAKINSLGWMAETSIKEGLEKTYKWYLDNLIINK